MPMATADALTGLGMPAQLANMIGANPNNQTGTGTTQTGATVIRSRNTELTAASSSTAFVFPTNVAVMEPYFLINSSGTATSALVYVPSGHTIISNGVGANGACTIAQNKSAVIWQFKPKNWAYLILA